LEVSGLSGVGEQNDLVSIIIVTRNGKTMTEQCVNSIFKNSNIDFEFIFVDNGSTDGTVEYLKQYKNRYLLKIKKIWDFLRLAIKE
jgi:glycosyltransferase involved in cell wall biosynthesis